MPPKEILPDEQPPPPRKLDHYFRASGKKHSLTDLSKIAEISQIRKPTASKMTKNLEELGILEKISRRWRYRFYRYCQSFDCLNEGIMIDVRKY